MRLLGGKGKKSDARSSSGRRGALSNGNRRTAGQQAPRHEATRSYYRPTSTRRPQAAAATRNHAKESAGSTGNTSYRFLKRLKAAATSPKAPSAAIVPVFAVLLFFASTLSTDVAVQLDSRSYSYRSPEEYSQAASNLLSANPLGRSKLLFRSDAFEADVLAAFPELDSATALLPLGGRDLTLQLSASEPIASIQSPSGSARLLNTTGSLVELPAHTSDTQALPRILLDESYAQSLQQGDQVLTASEVELVQLALHEFSADLRSNELGIEGVERFNLSIADGQLLVYLKGVSYYVKLSSYADVKQQVGGVVASLQDLAAKDGLPLEYIDARVPGRVFVK